MTLLPRILLIDDMFGRIVPNGRNFHRENLCASFQWLDVTDDYAAKSSRYDVLTPTCEVFFHRGQKPLAADVGSIVENDLDGVMAVVRSGWTGAMANGDLPWAMILLDLCFYTGPITEESNSKMQGIPLGRSDDDSLHSYFGLTILDSIHKEFPELPVMIFSSKPRYEVSLEFTERGAVGFIDKVDRSGPILLQEALWHHGLLPDSAGEIVGHSLPVLLALREARRAARHRSNLLIRGERGTGKELFSSYAHRVCDEVEKKIRPMITVNSAVLSNDLFASELFGIKKNTATGVEGKVGLIETAHGGDLFLDEIGDMQPEVQAAVLRVLQERQFTSVGSREPKGVDVRFISATNVDLDNGTKLRPDLLDRLRAGGTIWLPPLRERKTDIPLLAERFIRIAETEQKARRRDITPETLELLLNYDWPGNIRELQSCIYDAVNRFADVEHLVPRHLRINVNADKLQEQSTSLLPYDTVRNVSTKIEYLDVDSLLKYQTTLMFERKNIANWAGSFGDFEYSYAVMMSHYLKAALEETMKHSIDQPEGVIQIHPALKLMTGDKTLTSKKAYDLIKQILAPIESELDGILKEAFEKAIVSRGKPKIFNFPRKRLV